MEIQFTHNFANQLSLDELTAKFLLTETKDQQQRIKLVNSMLMIMGKVDQPLRIIFITILQIRQQEKQSRLDKLVKQNACRLLEQIVTKYRSILKGQKKKTENCEQSIVEKIIKYCCDAATSGSKPNQYINIIYQLHSKAKLEQQIAFQVNRVILNNLLLNPKIHVSSFSQPSRYKLYHLLLSSLQDLPNTSQAIKQGFSDLQQNKNENENDNSTKQNNKQYSQYITLVLSSISSQKDPRNMMTVFNLYLFILNSTSFSLSPFIDSIFEHLEQYYPLDFTGGQQHMKQYKVDCSALVAKLDQCLTHSVFLRSKHTEKMLLSKLSAPPISNCLGTLKMFFNRIRQGKFSFNGSWYSLVVNFAEQDYFQDVQQGERDSCLGQAISTVLNNLSCPVKPLIPYKCYKSVTQICNKLISKIWSPTKQWKYSGVAINIMRTLNEKLEQHLKVLLSTYLVAQFINNIVTLNEFATLQNNKNLVSQFGLFITVKFNHLQSRGVNQSISVILSFLVKVYNGNQGFLKVVVLKCLIQMQKNQQIKRLVRKIHEDNLIKSCIQMLKGEDSQLVNSYIDYLIETDRQTLIQRLQTQMQGQKINFESVIYGCFKSLKLILQEKQQVIVSQQANKIGSVLIRNINKSNMLSSSTRAILNDLFLAQLIHVITILGRQRESIDNQHFLSGLGQIVMEKCNQDHQQSSLVVKFILSFKRNWQIYTFRNLWRMHLKDEKVASFTAKIIKQQHQLQNDKQKHFGEIAGIYFNNSIKILKIEHTQTAQEYGELYYIYFLPIEQNISAQKRMVPQVKQINKQLIYPTSIHYHWTKYPSPILVSYLPQALLRKYSDFILQMIMPLNSMVVLNKILLHLPKSKISRHVITYCLKYLSKTFEFSSRQQAPVIEILAVYQILNKLYQMNQKLDQDVGQDQANNIFNVLQRQSDFIIELLTKGLQHRKRLVRQSSRLLLVKYQKLDSLKKI